MEQVEKLKEKANVTYEEAKIALEVSSGDMLDAIIFLEKQGKVKAPDNGGSFTTTSDETSESGNKEKPRTKAKEKQYGESFGSMMGRFFRWCGRVIAKGNVHMLEVRRNDEIFMTLPLTAVVLLLLFVFWIIVPLLVVGLFFGCRYYFRGPDLEKTGVNKVMGAAADAAEGFKKDIKESDNQ